MSRCWLGDRRREGCPAVQQGEIARVAREVLDSTNIGARARESDVSVVGNDVGNIRKIECRAVPDLPCARDQRTIGNLLDRVFGSDGQVPESTSTVPRLFKIVKANWAVPVPALFFNVPPARLSNNGSGFRPVIWASNCTSKTPMFLITPPPASPRLPAVNVAVPALPSSPVTVRGPPLRAVRSHVQRRTRGDCGGAGQRTRDPVEVTGHAQARGTAQGLRIEQEVLDGNIGV